MSPDEVKIRLPCADLRILNCRNSVNRADVADKSQQVGHFESAGLLRWQLGLPVCSPLPQVRLMVTMHKPDEYLGNDGRADRAEALAIVSNLRLFEDIVPKGRMSMQIVFFGDGPVGTRRDLIRRQ